MVRIAQLTLFSWQEIDGLRDLARLQLVINHMPNEKLMIAMDKKRKRSQRLSGSCDMEFYLSRCCLPTCFPMFLSLESSNEILKSSK